MSEYYDVAELPYDPTSLMTSITRFTRLPGGEPRQVRVDYVQVGPDTPGAVRLEGMPEGSWWVADSPEVPEGERMGRAEFDDAVELWRRSEDERIKLEQERLLRSADLRASRRAEAREELSALGLSDNTIDVLLGGHND